MDGRSDSCSVGRIPHPRSSHRRVVPWAATGFSLLWGAVFGLALSRDDLTLATFSGLGMGLTLVLTILMYRQQSQLRDLAETDTLTELTNHRGFQEVLRSELVKAALEREPVALVTLDLDDFKAINERHGHPFGDGVLQGVGAQLRNSVRSGDTAARTGGEEFALILPGTDADTAQEIAERVRTEIAAALARRLRAHLLRRGRRLPGRRRRRRRRSSSWPKARSTGRSAPASRRTRRFDPDHVRLSGDAPQRSEIQQHPRARARSNRSSSRSSSLTTGRLIGYEGARSLPGRPGSATLDVVRPGE